MTQPGRHHFDQNSPGPGGSRSTSSISGRFGEGVYNGLENDGGFDFHGRPANRFAIWSHNSYWPPVCVPLNVNAGWPAKRCVKRRSKSYDDERPTGDEWVRQPAAGSPYVLLQCSASGCRSF